MSVNVCLNNNPGVGREKIKKTPCVLKHSSPLKNLKYVFNSNHV